jgi:hypothetical protein
LVEIGYLQKNFSIDSQTKFMGYYQGRNKRKGLMLSMIILGATVIGTGIIVNHITAYFRSLDPIYHCISDPLNQPYQLNIPATALRDGEPLPIPPGIGTDNGCTKPVHTLQENVIHIGYEKYYPFTLGHFLYNWKADITQYHVTVFINGDLHRDPDFLGIILKDGMDINIQFTRK